MELLSDVFGKGHIPLYAESDQSGLKVNQVSKVTGVALL